MLKYKVVLGVAICWLSTFLQNLSAQPSNIIPQNLLHPKSEIAANLKPHFAFLLPYFPELKGLRLKVRERKQLIPLTTVPAVFNLFRSKKNWRIKINVSTQSVKLFEPILVKNMPDSAVIGVLGHELSHAKDFYTQGANYMMKIFFSHLNSRKIDAFEYNTDLIAIKAGIGPYLKTWSTHTHNTMPLSDFNRKKDKQMHETERYMKPETIEKYMKAHPEIYGK